MTNRTATFTLLHPTQEPSQPAYELRAGENGSDTLVQSAPEVSPVFNTEMLPEVEEAQPKMKHPGGRKRLSPDKKRVQITITLPPYLLGLLEEEQKTGATEPSVSQLIQQALVEHYRAIGAIPKS